MIPLSMRMCNFLSYRGETPVFDFTTFHVACLSGDNGAGKSSFLEAIHWAVWGEARLREPEIITRGAEKMFVEFVFRVQDSIYRINRSYSKIGKHGNRLELYQATDETRTHWDSLTGGSMRETQAKINDDIVGMSYEVFANSAYLRQGRADSFTQLTPTERRDLLAQMLEIDRYNVFRDRAKASKEREQQHISMLQGQIAVDEQSVAQIPTLAVQLDEAEARVTTARAFVQYAQAAVARQQARQLLNEHTLQLAVYTQRRDEIAAERARLDALLADRADIEAAYARLVGLEAAHAAANEQRDRFDALQAERHHGLAVIAEARAKLVRTIDRAQSEREQLIQAVAAAADMHREYAQLTTQRDDTEADQSRLAQLEATRNAQSLAIRGWERDSDRLQTLVREHADACNSAARAHAVSRDAAAVQAQVEAGDAAAAEIEQLLSEHAALNAEQAGVSTEQAHITDQGKSIRAKIDALVVQGHCPTCHGIMDESHVATAKAALEDEITALRTQYKELERSSKSRQQRLEDITARVRELRTSIATLPEARRRLTTLSAALLDGERLTTHIAALESEITVLQATDYAALIDAARATVTACERERDTLTQRLATSAAHARRITQLEQELARVATQQQRIETLDAKIAEFEADLHGEQFETATHARVATLDSELATLGYDPQLLNTLRNDINALRDVRDRYNALAVLDTQSAALAVRSTDTDEQIQLVTVNQTNAQHEVDRQNAICTSLQPQLVGKDVQGAPAQLLIAAEHDLASRIDYASQLRVKQQAAYAAQARIEDVRTQLTERTTVSNRFHVLENAFASKGIQAMLIRDFAVPALERETNRILSQMTDNQLYLNIDTVMSTLSGAQRETVDIRVSDASGTRPLEAFSGGEAFRISFALRIALSKLLAHRAGHRLETLIIDEGFGTQDAMGRERLVEAINAISGEFKTILVITHVQEVRDLFPVQIMIRRTEAGSSWEVLS